MTNTVKADIKPVVAFLGPKGTYSQAAVHGHFGASVELLERNSIDDVFAAVELELSEFGVVPVENSTEGAINNTQDCLIDSPLKIVGEQIVLIEHQLLQARNGTLDGIKSVASHKQSLAQCRQWLKEHLPDARQIECASNAQAALLAQADPSIAAIAGVLAAQLYDLSVLHSGIQDQQHNSTRFLIMANAEVAATGKDKTSVLIYTENKPGALFRILQPFESLQISLTKIETRPSKKEAWEYVFFIDFEGHAKDEKIRELFSNLASSTAEIKILGSYPLAREG